MIARIRRLVTFGLGTPILLFCLLRALGAGPPLGTPVHRGGPIVERAVAERHTNNAVAAVVFDYRGYDTLGEEFILFGAVLGVSLLLRETGDTETWSREAGIAPHGEALELAGYPMLALTLIIGVSLIFHGHLTPGGGFQGGAVVASGLVLVYLLGGPRAVDRVVTRTRLDVAEALGLCAFSGLATGTVVAGRPVLANVLRLGTAGDLLSSGTILLLNAAVGLSVAAGFALVVLDFLRTDGIR